MPERILIIGLGSIGQRHARNALALGCGVIGYDPKPYPPQGMHTPLDNVCCVTSIEAGLGCHPLGVIVATPPETHCHLGRLMIEAGLPTLIEKPMAENEERASALLGYSQYKNIPISVGYQFRHTAALRRLKAQADAGEFGTIYAAHAEFASQRWCSKTYPADLLLECSHELDLFRWFLGDPMKAHGASSRQGTLVVGQIQFAGTLGTFALDGLHSGYRRRFTLYGTKGVGEWTLDQAENDQAYVDELAEFLRVCRGEQEVPSCTGRDGWWAVRMVEAIRKSGESGRWEAT